MSGLPAVPSYTTFVRRIHRDTASDQAWARSGSLGGHDPQRVLAMKIPPKRPCMDLGETHIPTHLDRRRTKHHQALRLHWRQSSRHSKSISGKN
ncbi:Hypothetical protein FKW44_003340 [Caligus rogercresseyi]|uniref:Uncharacterized protein n=1 Tax=Caligus rogercresseyi TaxID=217165 RepID=A0A7T8KLG1_CALRO|nr:Hypothetical protein FKW44_003340 [Caligus rogercresseyi]